MALKQRDLQTTHKPNFGVVKIEGNTHNFLINKIAQSNLAMNNAPVYAPNLDENLNIKTAPKREISYSFAFTSLYKSLNILKKSANSSNADTPETIETKKTELKLIDDAIEAIKDSLPRVAAEEYPGANPKFEKDKVVMKISGDPLKFKLTGATRKSVNFVASRLAKLEDFTSNNTNRLPKKALSFVQEYHKCIADKFEGMQVFLKDKSDEDITDDIKFSIEMLIRDDTNSSSKIDRTKAEQDLAKKLDKMGMELVCVEASDNNLSSDDMISQAKTCVLRATWDGFIERPKDSSLCSEALNSVLYKGLPKVDPRSYNLNDSPIWNICSQMPAFAAIKFKLGEALGKTGFPPEKIKDLTFADIAYVINMDNYKSSAQVEKMQRRNKTAVDGYRIKSDREAFMKKYIHNHENDLCTLLKAQGKSEEYISSTIRTMKSGKSINGFDGHHNFPISDPDTYEKTTGKKWYQMNNDVVLIAKEPHTLLHMTENNVNAGGRVILQDAKSSHRTIFTNKDTGQKFYYMIRVKNGIDSVLGLRHEAIFDKDFLSGTSFEQKNNMAMQHAKQRLKKLKDKKDKPVDNVNPKDKDVFLSNEINNTKEESRKSNSTQSSRSNYRGQKQFGGSVRTLAQIR